MYVIWKLWEIDRDENITDWYTKLFFKLYIYYDDNSVELERKFYACKD